MHSRGETSKSKLRFDDKVVLVTGGSRGLGRAFSLYFASLGATVVINSTGAPDDEQSESPASVVTKKLIEAQGGKAEVFDAPVSDAEAIIDYCHLQFGRLDAVVHNAGFVRDASFVKSTLEEWQAVQSVHLEAAYRLSHAAWPLMKSQGFGRLLFISSAAGLYGNFGQANYSAAKLGMVGLAKTLAVEGARNNIHCNCVAPIGITRMNADVLDESMQRAFPTAAIAPLVAYLCHASCQENGSLFEAAGGWFSKVRFQRSEGAALPPAEWKIDTIAEQWKVITDFERAEASESMEESVVQILDHII
ncbi:SDR family NAD(P)-dependent oxidoreductase [Pseudomaricurvus alkylphenolicus]|uniref:SDR family NAD(P)-dependent oxidoreductase n=1 Tax=Pseudomaricurvus alkylphenolicus TaxID=1306991 RepID=UPI00141EC1A9|nr:SDR family NAD(P)-dependent oxidoreductase [Pseudomaricurvus alkylphenolicus]NIB38830.1 SDR family NAD(P)-dependent oxidoreductase [Pseudomaricurvus alkylphenolicus]